MKVKITTVPASGASATSEVEVEATGASVADVLKAAGVSDASMNITVGGEPATLKTHVAAGASVTLTEKARGS